jgi:ubiquinone/menaquinone biosynthesis C-methylase UbiE
VRRIRFFCAKTCTLPLLSELCASDLTRPIRSKERKLILPPTLKSREKQYFESCRHEVDAYDEEASHFIMNVCRKSNLIIEMGCGSGAWTRHLAKEANHVIGVDISPSLVKKTHNSLKYSNCGVIVCDAEFLPFKDKVADRCFFGFSLHHFPNLLQSIKEAARCLQDNGYMVMIEPNGLNFVRVWENQIAALLKIVNKAGLTSPSERSPNTNEIRRILCKLGFQCHVFPCYATLRKARSNNPQTLLTRIHTLTLEIACSIFPNVFGAPDFILLAARTSFHV